MARIRTIKPEFWTSEQVVECSPTARLLFVGLWNFCDDNGVHPASAKRAKMEVFPSDDLTEAAVSEMIAELIAANLISEFEANGKSYWFVTGWHHQKIEKPSYKYPKPPADMNSTTDHQPFREQSPNGRRAVADSSPPEWKGCIEDVDRNGREEINTTLPPRPPVKRSAPAAATVQAKPEGDGEGRRDPAEGMPDRFAEAFEAVKACGVRLAHDAVMIAIRNGFSIDGILAVVDVFHAEPGKWTEGALHERLTAAGMAEFAAHEGWVSPNPDWQKRQPKPRAKPVDLPTADLPSPLEPIYGDRLDRMTDQQIADLVRDSPRFTLRDKADAPRFGKSVKELRAKLLAAIQDGDMANGC